MERLSGIEPDPARWQRAAQSSVLQPHIRWWSIRELNSFFRTAKPESDPSDAPYIFTNYLTGSTVLDPGLPRDCQVATTKKNP